MPPEVAKKTIMAKTELQLFVHETFGEVYGTAAINRFRDHLRRAPKEGPKKANQVSNLIASTKTKIEQVIDRVVFDDELKYNEQLEEICRAVADAVGKLKEGFAGLEPDGSQELTNANAAIDAIHQKRSSGIRESLELKNDPGVGTEFERMSIEGPKDLWQMIEVNFGIFMFNNILWPYVKKLKEESVLPEDENINKESYAAIKLVATLCRYAVVDGVRDFKVRVAGRPKMTFGDFQKALTDRVASISARCKSDKVYRLPGVEFGEEQTRKCALSFTEAAIEAFKALSEEEFILIEPPQGAPKFHGIDKEDFLFLPKKAKAAADMAEGLAIADELKEDWESTINLTNVDDKERDELLKLWQESRDPSRGPVHRLNRAMRKEIAGKLNNALHGGLNLRHANDITRLIEQLGQWEIDQDRLRTEEMARMRAYNLKLLEYVQRDFVIKVVGKLMASVRGGFEKAQSVEEGVAISITKGQFQALLQTLKAIQAQAGPVIDNFGTLPTEALTYIRDSFSPRGRVRVDSDCYTFLSRILSNPTVKILPGLDDEAKREVFDIKVDCAFVLSKLGRHNEEAPVTVAEYDIEKELAAKILGPLYAEGNGVYDGPILFDEKEYLQVQCALHPLREGQPLDELIAEVERSGELAQWQVGLNDELHGGIAIRTIERIKVFVREIFVEMAIEGDGRGTEASTIDRDLLARAEAIRAWAAGLPGDSNHFYRKLLADLARRLAPEVISNMPAYVVASIVEKLELCMRRITVHGDHVRHNLTDGDLALLMDPPTMEGGRWVSVRRISFRLEDLSREIARLKERLAEKERAREALEERRSQKTARELEDRGYDAEVQARRDDIAARNIEIGQEYTAAGATGRAVDEDLIARLRGRVSVLEREIEALEGSKRSVKTVIDQLAGEIVALEVSVAGLDELMQEAERLRAARKVILDGIDVLYEQSHI